jgi:hypothetical protein
MAPYQAEQNQMALDQAEPNQMAPNQAKLNQMAQQKQIASHQAKQNQIASEHPDPGDFSLYAYLVLPFLLANTFQEQGVQQQRAHFHAFF